VATESVANQRHPEAYDEPCASDHEITWEATTWDAAVARLPAALDPAEIPAGPGWYLDPTPHAEERLRYWSGDDWSLWVSSGDAVTQEPIERSRRFRGTPAMWAKLGALWICGGVAAFFLSVTVAFGAGMRGDDIQIRVIGVIVLSVMALASLSAVMVARARKAAVPDAPPPPTSRVA